MPNIELGGRGGANSSIKPCMRGWLFFFEEPGITMFFCGMITARNEVVVSLHLPKKVCAE